MSQMSKIEIDDDSKEKIHQYILSLGGTEELWSRIISCDGVFMELIYWCERGQLWGGFTPEGISISDCIAWQVDHFKKITDGTGRDSFYRASKLFLTLMTDVETCLPRSAVRAVNPEPTGRTFDLVL